MHPSPALLHRSTGPTARSLCVLVLAAGLLAACGGDRVARDVGTRAVVVGIDGADWRVIEPLIEAGRMPHLAALRERSAWGTIETLHDVPLSPVIWTSVATGKRADEHGIAWFMVDRPDGTRAPVRSTNRTAEALWTILATHGRKAGVVGWWATYPAEEVGDGAIVSDAVGFHGFGATARTDETAGKTYPASLHREVAGLIPPEQQISAEFARRFLHVSPEEYRERMYTPARYARHDASDPIHLFQMYAATAQGYTAISEKLLDEEAWDLFMVYFEQVDSLSHLFMKYAPPKLDWVDREGFRRYRDTVAEWYAYQDELLGRVLATIDLDETAVFILSDHGFKTGDRRIRSERTVDVTRAHLDHEPEGIFLAAGPHIRRSRVSGASVLDVAPTVLHYLGFPVGKDMDGRVLEQIFGPEFLDEAPIRHIATYEHGGKGAAPGVREAEGASDPDHDPALAAENLEALRSLGYLGGGSAGGARRGPREEGEAGAAEAGESSPEIHNNLGRVHLRNGETQEARREFEKALELDPRNADALLNLANLDALDGRTTQAERLIQRALQVDPNSVAALAQLAELRRRRGDLEGAIGLYRQALTIDRQPFVYLGLGDVLQRAGRHPEAVEAFRSALELDPDSATAHYDLGVTYGKMGRLEEAVDAYERALELQPEGVQAAKTLNNLGALAQAEGDLETAATFFERAVEATPDHLESQYNLAMLRLRRGETEGALELLERASTLAPDHEQVNLALGRAYMEAGRGEEAYRSLLLVHRLYPQNWEAALGMAALHASAGQPERAEELFDEAIRLGGEAARTEAARYPALAEHIDRGS